MTISTRQHSHEKKIYNPASYISKYLDLLTCFLSIYLIYLNLDTVWILDKPNWDSKNSHRIEHNGIVFFKLHNGIVMKFNKLILSKNKNKNQFQAATCMWSCFLYRKKQRYIEEITYNSWYNIFISTTRLTLRTKTNQLWYS